MQGGIGLRGQDPGQALGGEFGDDPVVEDTGGVHHAGQRSLVGDRVEDACQGRTVADIARADRDARAEVDQLSFEFARARGLGAAPGEQRQVPYAVSGDQMAGHQRAQAAGAAGDQHGAVLAPGRGYGQHDLADVLRLAEESQRLGGPGDVPRRDREWPQRAALEQCQQLRQHLADPLRPGVHHVERRVRHARMGLGHLVRVPDVGLAHLDEPATGPRQPQRRVHELPGQAVQHHVQPGPVRGPGEDLLELRGAGGGDALGGHTQMTNGLPLGLTCGREHLRPQMLGELHRGHAHTTGRGMDQHRLARFQPCQIDQRVIRGQIDDRHGCRLRVRPAGRDPRQHAPIGDGRGAEPTVQQTHHPVADSPVRHPRTDLQDHTRALVAQQPGVAGIHVQHMEHITEIDARRPDGHPDLPRAQRCRAFGYQGDAVQPALGRDVHPPGGARTRRRHQHPARVHPHHTRQPGAAFPHGDLAGVRPRESGGEDLVRLPRAVDVGEREPARVLAHRRPHQSPHPGTGEIECPRSAVLGPHAHGAGGQHHQPRSGEVFVSQPRADRCQHTGHRVADRVAGGVEGEHDGVRDGRAGIERGDQCVQVGVCGGPRDTGAQPSVTEHRPGAWLRESGGGSGGGLDPVEAEQAVPDRGVRRCQLPRRHRPQHQRLHLGHRRTLTIGDLQGDLTGAPYGDAYPHRGGTGRRQRHAGPHERQGRTLVGRLPKPQRVQNRVQQRRVQAETGRLAGQRLGQRRLHVEVVALPPGLPQATEGRAVDEALVGQPLVQAVHRDVLRTGGRPHGQVPVRGHARS